MNETQHLTGEHGAVETVPSEAFHARIIRAARGETEQFHFRLVAAQLLLGPLPFAVGSRVRALGLRLAGFQIGKGVIIHDLPRIVGTGNLYRRLRIGDGCYFNTGCLLELEDEIVIGDRVRVAQEVMIVTSTHEIGPGWCRAADHFTKPVIVGAGAWLGARCTILPGVTVGAGAVVAAGAVVHRDVPPNTLVGGVPARVLRELP